MRTITEPDWPEAEDEDEEEPSEKYWEDLFEADDACIFDWNDPKAGIIEKLDGLLESHGLELVEYDGHGGTFTILKIGKLEKKE